MSEERKSFETCFAYIPPEERGRSSNYVCKAIDGGCPGFDKCSFYKPISKHILDVQKVYERINTFTPVQQIAIAEKHYDGKMPWKILVKKNKEVDVYESGDCESESADNA